MSAAAPTPDPQKGNDGSGSQSGNDGTKPAVSSMTTNFGMDFEKANLVFADKMSINPSLRNMMGHVMIHGGQPHILPDLTGTYYSPSEAPDLSAFNRYE